MPNTFELPKKRGVVYWPVGTGDSTSLVVRPGQLVIQIDLNHLEKADDLAEPEWPIVDHLVRVLPRGLHERRNLSRQDSAIPERLTT